MKTIAIIGSNWFVQQFKQSIKKDWDVQFTYHVYQEVEEAPELVERINNVDACIFAGSFPYEHSQEILQKRNIPAVYVRQDVHSLVLSLTRALLSGYALERISIDYRHEEEWASLKRELNGKVPTFSFPIHRETSVRQIVKTHQKNQEGGAIDLVITSVHAAAKELEALGIPTQRAVDSESSLQAIVDDAIQVATFSQLSDAQIAVGLITVPPENQAVVEKITHALDAVKQTDDAMIKLYTTVGKLRRFLQSDALYNWMAELKVGCNIGFGSGETLLKAEQHAHSAYRYQLQQTATDLGFYYVDVNHRLTGPYPQTRAVLDLAIQNEQLLTFSQLTGLSPVNVSKLIQFDQLNKNLAFTTDELAEYLQVTRRTAERLLKKLHGTPYLVIAGEQSKGGKGRPKLMYRLHLRI